MNDFKTIALTTDFSETSRLAFPAAITLAQKFGSKMLVVYVEEDRLPPFAGDFPGIQGIPVNDIIEDHRRRAGEELKRLAANELAALEVETVILSGVPHREIVNFAEERGVDLIVMATHGHGFIGHALMGSTTERVIRHAPCPVLAIRQTGARD